MQWYAKTDEYGKITANVSLAAYWDTKKGGRDRIIYLGKIYIKTESTVDVGHMETEEYKDSCKNRK